MRPDHRSTPTDKCSTPPQKHPTRKHPTWTGRDCGLAERHGGKRKLELTLTLPQSQKNRPGGGYFLSNRATRRLASCE